MKYEIAHKYLEEVSFIANDKLVYETLDIELSKCKIYFFCKSNSGSYYFRLEFYAKSDNSKLLVIDFDDYLCTYFEKHIDYVTNKDLFSLFLHNKVKFMQLLLRYNDATVMEKQLQKKSI